MVRLTTVGDPIEARIIAARLGSEGVLWELRGGIDGPYPMGPFHVYVAEPDLATAYEVLTPADDHDRPTTDRTPTPTPAVPRSHCGSSCWPSWRWRPSASPGSP